MIPYLRTQLAEVNTTAAQCGIVREYLQMRILQSLQDAGGMIPLAFHGGTALRLLYQMPRYSEDLDFVLERHPEQFDFQKYLTAIQQDMAAETYRVEIKTDEWHEWPTFKSALIRFQGLYHQLGLSPHATEIRLEVDTAPPAEAGLTTSFVQHHVPIHVQHHDQASLLAGKLHALLQRKYVKGRDWYDLYWCLRQPEWPLPNWAKLNNALVQSGWAKGVVTEENWREHLLARLQGVAWPHVVEDVQRFLIAQDDLAQFSQETVTTLLMSHNGE
jgi:predicted nucleotidyltransferase component of viral defense system